jgi:quinol monooxygenase YgiN
MVFVVATIETQAGRRGEVLDQFARIVPLVRQEDGCHLYTPSVDIETNIEAQTPVRSDVITVVEQWAGLEALEAHLVAPHMIEFRAAVKEMVKSVTLQIVGPSESMSG